LRFFLDFSPLNLSLRDFGALLSDMSLDEVTRLLVEEIDQKRQEARDQHPNTESFIQFSAQRCQQRPQDQNEAQP
jgi:hypothetical protein